MTKQSTAFDGFFDETAGDLAAFKELTAQRLDPASVPSAGSVQKNVPIYDMATLRPALGSARDRRALLAEWAWVLGRSAGVIVLRAAYEDTAVIDRATGVFNEIIAEERNAGLGAGDHFAAAGKNDRVWNALQKQCLRDPEGFALYYGNTAIAAACEAWLGPWYQMTAQINQVRPGGAAQQAHRDYHLGFQNAATAARFPAHAHEVTATLTLQGAVAHCDMPIESGPTKLLPFSQLYAPGFLAFHDAAHRAHFEQAFIQLPLAKGDAVFFNPALFHSAGENRSTDINRMANLLQISSAFGRAMESVDRRAMTNGAFSALADLKARGVLGGGALEAAIATTAEGYAFPTNLDTDPPIGGNAPASQADLLRTALDEGWPADRLADTLAALSARQTP